MESFFPYNNRSIAKKKESREENVDEFIRLCERLRANDPNTKAVEIGHYTDQAKTSALCEALGHNTVLQRIRLDFQNELITTPRSLLECLKYSPHLSIVDMFGMNFSSAHVCTILLLLLHGISRNQAVRELTLVALDVSDRNSIFSQVLSILQGPQKDCLLLQSELAASFRQLKYIECLWLEHINDFILCQILPSLRRLNHLQTLTIAPSPHEQSDTTFDTIGALLTASNSLERIELHDCTLTAYRMNTVARGLWNSPSMTELGLHTSKLDAGATNQLRALFCRQKRKRRGSIITSLSIGQGVQMHVSVALLLQGIMGSSKSTLERLDLKSRGRCDDDVLRYLANRLDDDDWVSAMFRTGWKSMTGPESEDGPEEMTPQLIELKWGLLETAESLTLFERVVENMPSLRKVSVDVDDSLDPAGILALCKSTTVEMCCINGQRYDLKGSSSDESKKRRKLRKQAVEACDEDEKSFEGSFDGIGLESIEAEQIDQFCDQDSSSSDENSASSQKCQVEDEVLVDDGPVSRALENSKACRNPPSENKDTENSTQPLEPGVVESVPTVVENAPGGNLADGPNYAGGKSPTDVGALNCSHERLWSKGESSSDLNRHSAVRQAPLHTQSDTAALRHMRGRLGDISKRGYLRNDPFYFERRVAGLDIRGGRSETGARCPTRSSSDTQALVKMQFLHDRQPAVKEELSCNLKMNGEVDVFTAEVCVDSDSGLEPLVDPSIEPSEARKEEIRNEIREDFAILRGFVPLPSDVGLSNVYSLPSGDESAFDLENSNSNAQAKGDQEDAEDSPSNLSSKLSDQTEIEQKMKTSFKVVVDLPEYAIDVNTGYAKQPKNDNMSLDCFREPDRLSCKAEADVFEEKCPSSFASPKKVVLEKFAISKNDVTVPDDNSSSSELIDFEMELNKVMG